MIKEESPAEDGSQGFGGKAFEVSYQMIKNDEYYEEEEVMIYRKIIVQLA